MSFLPYIYVVFYCLLQAHCSRGTPAPPPQANSLSTNLTSPSNSWSSWKAIENLFVFGDSYTSTGFDINGAQPSPADPTGNGWGTIIGSSVWSQYLTTNYNETFVKLFNLASSASTIDHNIDPSPIGGSSFRQEVDKWLPKYGNGQGGWVADNSLFLSWFGVNDVMALYAKSNASAYIDALTESYVGSAEKLYTAGARNFVFFNIPAVDRVPQPKASQSKLSVPVTKYRINNKVHTVSLIMTPNALSSLGRYIRDFNKAMVAMTGVFQQLYPEAKVWLFDTNTIFNRVLDDPKSYLLSAGIVNTTDDCAPYRHSTDPKLFRPECGVSRDKYFWSDGLHPGSTMQNLLAEQLVELLGTGNVATS